MLYRRERRTPPWLALLIGLAVALPLGFWLGRATAPEANLQDVLAPSRELVRQAEGALDIVLLEYGRAQQGSEASLRAAKSAAEQSRSRLEEAAPMLTSLFPERYEAARATEAMLQQALAKQAAADTVADIVATLRRQLAELLPRPDAGADAYSPRVSSGLRSSARLGSLSGPAPGVSARAVSRYSV